MQLCSSSTTTTTTTVTHSFTTEHVALTLKGHLVFAYTQTTVLGVLSDFVKRKVNLQGSDSGQSCIAILNGL